MNFGSRFTPVSFFTPAVPPFPANAADNGLSVDGVSGRIVLGNDFGDAAAPGRLLNFREIIMEDAGGNQFGIFLNSVTEDVISFLTGYSLEIAGGNNTVPFIQIGAGDNSNLGIEQIAGAASSVDFNCEVDSGFAAYSLRCDSDRFSIYSQGAGRILFQLGGVLDVWGIDTVSFNTIIGPNLAADNGATLQVVGSLTHRHLVNGFSGNRNIDRDLDSARLLYNTAAGTLVLPNMVGANARVGFNLRFACNHAGGITIQADAGQTIRVGTSATSSGGTLSSTNVGSYGRITLIDSFTWMTEYYTGSFVLT